MTETVFTKELSPSEYNISEILRYMGVLKNDADVCDLVYNCIKETDSIIRNYVCYSVVDISLTDNTVDFGFSKVNSASLASNLSCCDRAVIFSATIGLGIDRLIQKYGRISPSKALCMQAIGTERIESLCDSFIKDTESEYGKTVSRFSPGYGDLDINFQKDIFSFLGCDRKIGLTLNSSMIMSPSKSVTAVAGIKRKV